MACEVCREGRDRRSVQQIADDLEHTKQELLDRMLLSLYDALFLRMSETWSNAAKLPGVENVANMHVCETYALAKWWLAGMNVGAKPIFDGVCAQCGSLLHGVQYEHSATSNK
jgi:hypothetical protein